MVSGKGIWPNPSLISDVEAWNPPTSVHELKAFLGPASNELKKEQHHVARSTRMLYQLKESNSACGTLVEGKTSKH